MEKQRLRKVFKIIWGRGTLLISQYVVRREMLKVQDREGNLSIDLIRQIAEYGKDKCEFIIVEGILYKRRYGEMLNNLIQFFDSEAYTYYFDLSFDETLTRHNSREKKMHSERVLYVPGGIQMIILMLMEK